VGEGNELIIQERKPHGESDADFPGPKRRQDHRGRERGGKLHEKGIVGLFSELTTKSEIREGRRRKPNGKKVVGRAVRKESVEISMADLI